MVAFGFNEPGFVFEVNLFDQTQTVEITRFRPGQEKRLSTYFIQLETGSDPNRAFNMFNRLRGIIKCLPLELVRHTNVPRVLPAPIPRHALQERAVQIDAPAPTTPKVVWDFGGGVKAEFTGFLTTPLAKKLWLQLTGKASPSDEPDELLPLPAADVDEEDELPKNMGTCGGCKTGIVPTIDNQIRARRFRKEWIGCFSGLACKSSSFWFHVEDQPLEDDLENKCAGLSRHPMPKTGAVKWYCRRCRVDRVEEVNEVTGWLLEDERKWTR